jgi:hypothetical protein
VNKPYAGIPRQVVSSPGELTPLQYALLAVVLAECRHNKACTLVKSKRALLKLAGLSTGQNNRNRLDEALQALSKPIGKSPPLIKKYKVAHGSVWITIYSSWLDDGYVRVPMPLPRRPVELALYLWLHHLDPRYGKRDGGEISLQRLSIILGLHHTHHIKRALRRALGAINSHLSKLDIESCAKDGLDVPERYRMKFKGASVTFWVEPRCSSSDFLDMVRKMVPSLHKVPAEDEQGEGYQDEDPIDPFS